MSTTTQITRQDIDNVGGILSANSMIKYIDKDNGNDNNSGDSETDAWASLDKAFSWARNVYAFTTKTDEGGYQISTIVLILMGTNVTYVANSLLSLFAGEVKIVKYSEPNNVAIQPLTDDDGLFELHNCKLTMGSITLTGREGYRDYTAFTLYNAMVRLDAVSTDANGIGYLVDAYDNSVMEMSSGQVITSDYTCYIENSRLTLNGTTLISGYECIQCYNSHCVVFGGGATIKADSSCIYLANSTLKCFDITLTQNSSAPTYGINMVLGSSFVCESTLTATNETYAVYATKCCKVWIEDLNVDYISNTALYADYDSTIFVNTLTNGANIGTYASPTETEADTPTWGNHRSWIRSPSPSGE